MPRPTDALPHLQCDVFVGKHRNTRARQIPDTPLTAFTQNWHPITSVHIPLAKADLMTKWHITEYEEYSSPVMCVARGEWRFTTTKKVYLKGTWVIVCLFFNWRIPLTHTVTENNIKTCILSFSKTNYFSVSARNFFFHQYRQQFRGV